MVERSCFRSIGRLVDDDGNTTKWELMVVFVGMEKCLFQ